MNLHPEFISYWNNKGYTIIEDIDLKNNPNFKIWYAAKDNESNFLVAIYHHKWTANHIKYHLYIDCNLNNYNDPSNNLSEKEMLMHIILVAFR